MAGFHTPDNKLCCRCNGCNAARQPWQPREMWHCGICNLQNLKDQRRFESHSLRQNQSFRFKKLRLGLLFSVQRRVLEPVSRARNRDPSFGTAGSSTVSCRHCFNNSGQPL
jgi:hypothetical protein